jgi:DNA-directed RNA polymerase subunit M/transcription elongation factor TFIIS
VLKQELSNFNKLDYDTEEKEFICDLFHELTTIINIDLKDNLNKWLYGSFLTSLMKVKSILSPEKIIETLRQPCTNCGTQLESYVMQKEKVIQESSWYLVKCKSCKELNLLSCGNNIKEIKFGNYEYIETFPKSEYTYEQALNRLEQIKFFRK